MDANLIDTVAPCKPLNSILFLLATPVNCWIEHHANVGPELGPLKSLLIAPEKGSWRLEEVTVSSSRSRHTDRWFAVLIGAPDHPRVAITCDQSRAITRQLHDLRNEFSWLPF